ncbi:MAG: MMPL family transporter, partial [Pseudomonadota bacterium]
MEYALARWVGVVIRYPWWVLAVLVAMTFGATYAIRSYLGVNTSTTDMFSPQLSWRIAHREYSAAFPELRNALTLVIDAKTPELARDSVDRLASALRAETDYFEWVYAPARGEFFSRHGLLYLDLDELDETVERLATAQPLLGRLVSTPNLVGLAGLIDDVVSYQAGQGALSSRDYFLAQVAHAMNATTQGREHRLSWEDVMQGQDSTPGERRQFLLAKPRLDFNTWLAAEPGIERVRALTRALALDATTGVRVRITGGVALEHEELESASRGVQLAGLVALILVAGILLWGVRSIWLTVLSLVTLLAGLTFTAAFAALAIGHLNLISIAFAVLYIGLGIDYALHFSARLRELTLEGVARMAAIERAVRDVGVSLAICTLTTGIGFLAFVPTPFSGVSELGVISAAGMLISLIVTLTALPAMVAVLPGRALRFAKRPITQTDRTTSVPILRRWRGAVLAIAGVFGVLGAMSATTIGFDHNPLNLRDPDSESVMTYRELLAERGRPPWAIVGLAKSEAELSALTDALSRHPEVERVASVRDFVPSDQDDKLDRIDELSLIMGPSLSVELKAVGVSETRERWQGLRQTLEAAPNPSDAVRALTGSVDRYLRLLSSSDPSVARSLVDRLQTSLLGHLPSTLGQLAAGLEAGPVARDDLPHALLSRWVAPDGRFRVRVLPVENIDDNDALQRFVDGVRETMPDSSGTPVINLEASRAVVSAFAQAFTLAGALVLIVLYLMFRNARDVAVVFTPLVLAVLLTVLTMFVFELEFNFANVITLPLLVGIGVDNGVHMVHRMRRAPPPNGNLLSTSTARAVFASALTTAAGFGNLALSEHRGMASMGLLLTIGLAAVLICTLVVLPSLLAPPPEQARG